MRRTMLNVFMAGVVMGTSTFLISEAIACQQMCKQYSGFGNAAGGTIICRGYDPYQSYTTLSCNSCDGGKKQGTPLDADYYFCDDNACQLYCGAGANNQEADPLSIMTGCLYQETQLRAVCASKS